MQATDWPSGDLLADDQAAHRAADRAAARPAGRASVAADQPCSPPCSRRPCQRPVAADRLPAGRFQPTGDAGASDGSRPRCSPAGRSTAAAPASAGGLRAPAGRAARRRDAGAVPRRRRLAGARRARRAGCGQPVRLPGGAAAAAAVADRRARRGHRGRRRGDRDHRHHPGQLAGHRRRPDAATTPPATPTPAAAAPRHPVGVADRLAPPPTRRVAAVRRAVGPVLHAARHPLAGRLLPERRSTTARSPGRPASTRSPGRSTAGQTTWYGEACSGPLPGAVRLQRRRQPADHRRQRSRRPSRTRTTARSTTPSPGAEPAGPGQRAPRLGGHLPGHYTNAAAQGATWTDEQAAVVVVDTGDREPARRCSSRRCRTRSARPT